MEKVYDMRHGTAFKQPIQKTFESYAREHFEELLDLVKSLCQIPAPSHFEDRRAAFCKEWLERFGAKNVFIDGAKNTVYPFKDTGGEAVLLTAHTDTVFPDLEPMPMREKGGKLFCPGVGDDTVNLAILLMAARYMQQSGRTPKCDLIFAANSCEEGLGNLKGCRALIEKYGGRLKEFVSFDLGLDTMFVKAVGSARFKVKIRTAGGHSWNDFGTPNAICEAAKMIEKLYSQKLPSEGRTTVNVGTISGGTSVNTIAQYAEFLYEYRSESAACMETMRRNFINIVDSLQGNGRTVEVEELGVRPGMGACKDEEAQQRLFERVERAIERVTGKSPKRLSGSTDCNIPFSQGIPSVCFGLATMGGTHTREEYIQTESIVLGLRAALLFISDYFE